MVKKRNGHTQRCKRGPAHVMWDRARRRAAETGKEFSISEADIEIPPHCPVLGLSLRAEWGRQGVRDTSPSLDRIDSDRGYVPGNIRVISMRANTIKSNASAVELRAVADYVDKESILSVL